MTPMVSPSNHSRVLFISYLFPPTGGVGVLRSTKFVKFLPEFGWDVTVLTAENPSVPLWDESLLQEIPDRTVVRTARTFEPGYAVKKMVATTGDGPVDFLGRFKLWGKSVARRFVNAVLQPDTSILWYPRAVREGLRAVQEEKPDAIFVSAPPFSSLLVAAAIARKAELPLVVDYRDEWTISNAYWENKRQGRLGNAIQQQMQRSVLRTAKAIIATTPGSAAALERIAQSAGSQADSVCIYNGFDPAEFPHPENLRRPDYGNGTDRFRIAFVGTLWKLTTIEPFVKAIRWIAEAEPSLLERLEIVIAGRQVGDELTHLESLAELPCQVVNVGFLDHKEALQLMATSDCLLQLLSELPNIERVIASKLFEYMGARRPILAISGPGDHWDVLKTLPQATVHRPNQTERIAHDIVTRLSGQSELDNCGESSSVNACFHRRELTRQLAAVLSQVSDQVSDDRTEVSNDAAALPLETC